MKSRDAKALWEMNLSEFMKSRATVVFHDGWREYMVYGFPRDPVPWQKAVDRCMYDKTYGHLTLIIWGIKHRGIQILTVQNYVMYEAPLKKWFIENPEYTAGGAADVSSTRFKDSRSEIPADRQCQLKDIPPLC